MFLCVFSVFCFYSLFVYSFGGCPGDTSSDVCYLFDVFFSLFWRDMWRLHWDLGTVKLSKTCVFLKGFYWKNLCFPKGVKQPKKLIL